MPLKLLKLKLIYQKQNWITLEEISTQMCLLTFIQIACHRVLANEIALNLKYRIGLKHFFNINLGIGIIKKTTLFVCIFDISPCVFTQISIERAHWMWTLLPQKQEIPEKMK